MPLEAKRCRSQAIARVHENTSSPLCSGPLREAEIVDEAEYRAMRHAREAAERSEGEAENIGELLGALFDNAKTARERYWGERP
jgi:hypothetical protein